jgi:glycosyltransferase involved in cell wall biosynthesis
MLFFPAETFPTSRVRLTVLFGRELFRRGHRIDLVMQARDRAVVARPTDWCGRTVFVGPTDDKDGFQHRAWKHIVGFAHDLRRILAVRRADYECILVSDKYVLASIAAIVARAKGMRFFFWLTFAFHKSHVALGTERLARYPRLSVLRGRMATFLLHRWIVPLSHHVFVQSEHMASDFQRHGADAAKLTPIVTGVDLADMAPRVDVRTLRQDAVFTVGYLGTLQRERRLEVLVDMLPFLNSRGLRVRLLLVGDGEMPEDRASLERRAVVLGVGDQIEITGMLPRPIAIEKIKDADVCLSPIYPSPVFDGASPTKLVEYMALGIPVVANSHPDQSTVLKQSRAGLCVPWGARFFARAVYWLSQLGDEELASLGQRGRVWVESERSYTKIADTFERQCVRALSVARK